MSASAANKQAILRGFTRLRTVEEQTALNGMRKVGETGLDLVVQYHREHDSDMIHLNEDDTLAYAVAHDGKVVASGNHSGGDFDMPGEATEEAKDLLASTKGYAAIVLSDMAQPWYNATYELDFLTRARGEIETSINEFFKQTDR